MLFCDHLASSRISMRCCALAALIVAGSFCSQARAEVFDGPSFRKGMWRFVRTLDVVLHRKIKHRLLEQDTTRCVDPTEAMKVTFSLLPVGNCVSAKPQRANNTYTFSNRCDYMGPVSTIITVHNDEAYTELNQLTAGSFPKTDLVTAHRIGDCPDDAKNSGSPPVLAH